MDLGQSWAETTHDAHLVCLSGEAFQHVAQALLLLSLLRNVQREDGRHVQKVFRSNSYREKLSEEKARG